VELREVLFGFFVVLAATLNFGYFVGDISDPTVHNSYGLIGAVAVNLLTTVLKWGDRTQLGAVHRRRVWSPTCN
jgi:hypothetical protein